MDDVGGWFEDGAAFDRFVRSDIDTGAMASDLMTELDIPSAGARRTAEHRARALSAKEPTISDTAARVRRLFAA